MNKTGVNVAAILCAAATLTGCAGHGRLTGADWRQDADNIFRPLDLPTPTGVRLGSGAPGPQYWQPRADYRIDATLDPVNRVLTATARVTYTNNAPEPLGYLWIHLEQNLFNNDSIGARLTRGEERFGNRDGFNGGYTITSITHNGRDLPLAVYDTLGRVELPQPIPAAGGVFTFDIAWSFPIPEYGSDRLAIEEVEQGTIFQLAQWFPAVVKYDDVHGWNALPYIGQGEFYTDFGDYELTISAPREFLVVATGELLNPTEVLTQTQVERLAQARSTPDTVDIISAEEVGEPSTIPSGSGPRTWRFRAEDVRTVAFAASDAFIWDAAGASTGTLIQSVYPKEGLPLWAKSTEYLRFSVEHYSEKWFPYPYPVAINVNGDVGGMEYPMIIFCRNRRSEEGLFGVTTHEIGHNWFPMIVSNDERRHAWMDEGFNTFINYYATEAYFGEPEARRGDAQMIVPAMLLPNQQPIETPADYVRRNRLGILQYAKTGAGLVLLREQILGPDRFDRAFRDYIERWAFKSPRPADFFRAMEDAAGADLSWFWRGWFLETGTLDQAVTRIEQDGDGEAVITFRNLGRLVMPVNYEVIYDDGSSERRVLPVEAWAVTDTWPMEFNPGRRIREVVIDPDMKFPDTDRSNNRRRR